MSSTSIYIPYTYLIGWRKQNVWYYGRRTAKDCNPTEFWNTYHTSSRHVRDFAVEHGDPDVIEIRRTFSSAQECKKWESTVLRRINAANDGKFLNKKNGDEKWDTTNCVSAKLKDGTKLGIISLNDPRWISGEIVISRDYTKSMAQNNSKSKAVKINGVEYPCVLAASRALHINDNTIRDYLKNRRVEACDKKTNGAPRKHKIWEAYYIDSRSAS